MRRRWIRAALVAGLALASAGAGAWAAATSVRQQIEVEYRQIQIQVDGEPVTVDAEPFLYNGRVFIPARPLAEALGAKTAWDETSSTVQVYTKYYATSRVAGDQRIWSMPGAGFEIRSPLGWVRQESDPSALLHLALPDPTGLNSLVGVTRLPENPAALSAQFDQAIAGMQAVYTDLEVANRSESTGRVSATATAKLAGQPVGLAFRMIASPGGHWLLFALYPQATQTSLEPAVQAIFDSFVLK